MKKQYDIVGNRKKFFIFSGVLILAICAFSLIFGVQMDIQFKGGAMLTYSYTGTIDEKTIADEAKAAFSGNVSTQTGSDIATHTQTITITLPGTETVNTAEVEAFGAKLSAEYGANHFSQLSMNNVNPTMGKEFFAKCVFAVVLASLLILGYIAIRFRKIGGWPAGSMAVVALVHDLIVIFGVFVIARIPLNSNFIAAALTILGYSINDTVVIYDRVRENRQLYGNSMDFGTLVNLSINQSLRRSINTTVSTILALGTVCVVSGIYGLSSIFTFAFPLIIGMISGVYSTVFIAGPLWVEWENFKVRRLQKGAPKKKKA
ncbi:MAG: protein translocase subunit SecF [Ruthenibacterium sp.]